MVAPVGCPEPKGTTRRLPASISRTPGPAYLPDPASNPGSAANPLAVVQLTSEGESVKKLHLSAAAALMAMAATPALPSSHREAPFIAEHPKVDGTDFYMFMSYEPNRAGYVTLIANYDPLQDAYGGPNYFSLDPNALYEIE